MIRLAIIGIGRMGTYHTKVARDNAQVRVDYLVSPSAPTIDGGDAVHVTDHTQIIGKVDAAIVATPTPTHFAITRDLLAAGIHVLVEKPITPTLAEAQELFALATVNNCVLQIGHVERFNPAFIAAQKMLTGTPLHIRTTRSGPYHPRVGHDSVVLDLMIHDIDLICTLLKKAPQQVHASGLSHVSATTDTASAVLQFESTTASCNVHRGAASSTREMIIETPTQTLHLDFGTRTLITIVGNDKNVVEPVAINPLGEQLLAFITAIEQETSPSGRYDLMALESTLEVAGQIKTSLVQKLMAKTYSLAPQAP